MRASANWRSSPTLVVVVVCIAVFTDIFLYGLIVPVLPFALEERIGLSGKDVQRWSSILLATYGGSILIRSVFAGWLGDQTCKRTKQLPFLAGMLIAGGATLLFYLLLDTVGNTIIGHALGFTSMSLSLGLFAGPIVGGFIYNLAGYLAVYGYSCDLQPISNANVDQNGPSTVEDHPLSSVVILLHSPRFAVAMVGMALLNTFMTAFEAVLPIYLHEVFGYKSKQVAVVFLSNTVPMVSNGSFGPALTGFALAGPSMMLLAMIQTDTMVNSVLLRGFLFLFGCSISLAMPAMMKEISFATEAVEHAHPGIFGREHTPRLTAWITLPFAGGGALAGPLYAGYLRDWFGWNLMIVSMGVLSLAMAGLTFGYAGEDRTATTERRDL
ncbi:MFS general substrate transporter [Aspergillus violaceofuscus CBS 115571]|uniref:MFS general substrate transporter n=1 Tax=Aspergillus violaceofuscus (strain CBS 115571) TaxID=1450538 RepID=A0A2V5HAM1_ASPV1|nr:MFS general substrate transporter [Aspergillus violaceofuscus CBS 115571]